MKQELAVLPPGLAILTMDVWADVFVYPWITRQQLAEIVHRFKERAFAEKLQTFLHDPKCGKHSLRFLRITWKDFPNPEYQLRWKNPQYQASLAVAPSLAYGMRHVYKDCEFPESEMPENINSFKRLTIRHLDNEVLDFLHKIKPLFTDVFLDVSGLSFSTKSAKNVRILFGHFLPMLASIRKIRCSNECIQFLEQHFNGTLAMAKEMILSGNAKPAFIPAYLNWLNAPFGFGGVHGPRCLKTFAKSETIFAIVDAVRKQFLTASTPSTFVIFIQIARGRRGRPPYRADELSIKNATTKEQLTVRKGVLIKQYGIRARCVGIQRHPIGADAIMRDWIKEHAFKPGDEGKHIWIQQPTIGHITKETAETKQNEDGSDDDDQDELGPSTSAKKMKK